MICYNDNDKLCLIGKWGVTMKKNIIILTTILISLFICSGKVSAKEINNNYTTIQYNQEYNISNIQFLAKDLGDVNSCQDLFGDELYEKINDYFGVVKIVVPLLLIGLGIFDFAKAMFGGEEDMKKSRKTFFLRIIAAVIFFLLPTLIKLILTIANEAWGFINPETCIK